jgi:prepilin-type N-terminal cleavage/methylation domain-containing protein
VKLESHTIPGRFIGALKAGLRLPKREHAFTLLELLVAMAVLAILVLMLMNMVDSATRLWRINENRVEGYREPRAALGIVARDLKTAMAGTNMQFFRLNDAGYVPAGATVGTNASHVFFLSAMPAGAQWTSNATPNKSDICEIGYFVGYGKTSASSNSPVNTLNLYRYFLSSDETYAALKNTNSPSYPFPAASTIVLSDKNVELLARNIVSFKITAYSAISQTNATNAASVQQILTNFVSSTNSAMPDLIEITLTAVNQDTAKKLSSQASWSATNSQPIKDNLQTFTTRIRLENKP